MGAALFLAGCTKNTAGFEVPDRLTGELAETRKTFQEQLTSDSARIEKQAEELGKKDAELESTKAELTKTQEDLARAKDEKSATEQSTKGMQVKMSNLIEQADLKGATEVFNMFQERYTDLERSVRSNILGSYSASMYAAHDRGLSGVSVVLWTPSPASTESAPVNAGIVLFDKDAGILMTTTTSDEKYFDTINRSGLDINYLTRSPELEFSFMKTDVLSSFLRGLEATSSHRPQAALTKKDYVRERMTYGSADHTTYDVLDAEGVQSLLHAIPASDSASATFSVKSGKPFFADLK